MALEKKFALRVEHKPRRYVFLCDCGAELRLRGGALKLHSGLCRRCAQLNAIAAGKHEGIGQYQRKMWRPYEHVYNYLYQQAGYSGHVVDLTYEQFLEFTKQPLCTYCRQTVNWEVQRTGATIRYNLDRVENTKGYLQKNCVVCCSVCNRVRGNMLTHEEMLLLSPVLQQIIAARTTK